MIPKIYQEPINPILNPFTPPPIEEFLLEEYWAMHEAAFVLTEWPEHNLFLSSLSYYHTDQNVTQKMESNLFRSFMYLPIDQKIDPKVYGEKFEDVYCDLKEAIENGSLSFKTQINEGIVFLVSPCEVITWALLKGYILPDELQKAVGISQDLTILGLAAKTRNALPIKVRQKIAAQFFLAKEPAQSRKQLCQNVLKSIPEEGRFFKVNEKRDLTVVRNNINELFEKPGKRGRRTEKNHCIEPYTKKAIEEVVKKDSSGKLFYNVPLFKVAMETAVNLKIGAIERKRMIGFNWDAFLKEFLGDEVVNLYLPENEYLIKIMMACFNTAWSNFILYLSMEEISNKFSDGRRGLKIIDGKIEEPSEISR